MEDGSDYSPLVLLHIATPVCAMLKNILLKSINKEAIDT